MRYLAGESLRALSAEVPCCHKKLGKLLQAEGVQLRGRSGANTLVRRNAARIHDEVVAELYVELDWNVSEIATYFGVSGVTISRKLRSQGVEVGRKPRATFHEWAKIEVHRAEIIKRYVKNGETGTDLAHIYDIPYQDLRSAFAAWGIKMRPPSDARTLLYQHLRRLVAQKAKVVEAYRSGVEIPDLAVTFAVGEMAVVRFLGGTGELPAHE